MSLDSSGLYFSNMIAELIGKPLPYPDLELMTEAEIQELLRKLMKKPKDKHE